MISPKRRIRLASSATRVMQEVFQLPLSDQLFQMIPQISAILGGMSMILMILAVKVLVTIHRISCHLIRSSEERLVLNLFQNLLHWFSKHNINCLSVG